MSKRAAVPRRKSQIPDPKSEIDLPVTILLSIQAFFIRSRAHIEDIYLIPTFIVLILVGRPECPGCLTGHRIDRQFPEVHLRYLLRCIKLGCLRSEERRVGKECRS